MKAPWSGLPRGVVALGCVSFLNDVASEMVFPLLPAFVRRSLGLGAGFLGALEGTAETVISLVKPWAGAVTDRARRRKPFVVSGYAISAVGRAAVGLARTGVAALPARLADRVGKGLRTPGRDALIADMVEPGWRGRAYALHRGMDHAGAIVGSLLAAGVLAAGLVSDLRELFLWTLVPAGIGVLVVALVVRETPRADPAPRTDTGSARRLHPELRRALLAFFLFTLGNSSDIFLLVLASERGVPDTVLPLVWAALHVAKALASWPGGHLADRLGARRTVLLGWAWYAATYVALAFAGSAGLVVALTVVYGVHHGFTEGAERALVADLAEAPERGRAFGVFHLAVGVGALPASLGAGLLYETVGPAAAFGAGAALAAAAAAVLAKRRQT